MVKISGLYRASSGTDHCYDDLEPIILALAQQVPDQLIWASDWPHTGEGANRARKGHGANLMEVEHFRVIDNEGILKKLRTWIGSDERSEEHTSELQSQD